MVRLATLGAETQDGVLESASYLAGGSGVAPSFDTAIYRPGCGKVSWKCDSGAGNGDSRLQWLGVTAWTASTSVFFRMAYRFKDFPSSTVRIFASNSDLASGVSIRITSTGDLQVWDDNSAVQKGSNFGPVALNEWHVVELKCVLNASKVITSVEWRLDGTTINSSTVTNSISIAIPLVGWLAAPGASKVLNIDDLGTNDSTGGNETTYCGLGSVGLLVPSSHSNIGLWTGGAGGVTNIWQAVDNTPPVGVADASATDTSQIEDGSAGTSNCDLQCPKYTDPKSSGGLSAPPQSSLRVYQYICSIGSSQTSVCTGTMELVANPQAGGSTSFNFNQAAAAGTYPTNWLTVRGPVQYGPLTVPSAGGPILRVTKTQSQARKAFACFMGLIVELDIIQPAPPYRTILQHINRAASF